MGKFKNKKIVISGATRGLGAACAHYFAREGATLILLGRRVDALEALDESLDCYDVETTLVPIDLSKPDRLESLPQALGEKYGVIDVLVGNAAHLGALSPVTHYSPREFEKILNVNYVSNWHLMTGLEVLLEASQYPRIIMITDSATSQPQAYWGPYLASKAALETLVQSYAAEKSSSALRVNLFAPGPMATGITTKAFPGLALESLAAPETMVETVAYLASEACQESGKLFGPALRGKDTKAA